LKRKNITAYESLARPREEKAAPVNGVELGREKRCIGPGREENKRISIQETERGEKPSVKQVGEGLDGLLNAGRNRLAKLFKRRPQEKRTWVGKWVLVGWKRRKGLAWKPRWGKT